MKESLECGHLYIGKFLGVKMTVAVNVCVCLLDDVLYIYKSLDLIDWSIIPIKGEEQYHHAQQIHHLKDVLENCNQRLNLENQLRDVHFSLIYAEQKAGWCVKFVELLTKDYANHSFQVRPLQHLLTYYAEKNNKNVKIEPAWIEEHILPLLTFDSSWKQSQQMIATLKQQQQKLVNDEQLAKSDFQQRMQQLEQNKAHLQKEILDKKQQLAIIQRPNLEALLSFLPSIFKNFWHTVRPDELANIAGLLEAPNIPSPYHNPTRSTVQAKKRQFLQLQDDEQQRIIGFCYLLKQDFNLDVHLEFQPLIGALD